MINLTELLQNSLAQSASDLHLSSGLSPNIRIHGELKPLQNETLNNEDLQQTLFEIMTEEQRANYVKHKELDFAWQFLEKTRLRINLFQQNRGISAAIRIIPGNVLTLEQLNLPAQLSKIVNLPHGLVLVCGATGSGKSTTLAALIEKINCEQSCHIITLEDPIEFIYENKKSIVNQREIYRDSMSFNSALRAALREDPDVILVGEMRDLETIRLALTAAETGHLVFATLHSASATNAINRIIDVFPGDEKNLVRSLLAESLQAIICQTLVNKIPEGRVAAVEMMLNTPAIKNLIRENKTAQIYSAMQTGSVHGMQTFEQHLAELRKKGIIN